jgi:hypothetical protein
MAVTATPLRKVWTRMRSNPIKQVRAVEIAETSLKGGIAAISVGAEFLLAPTRPLDGKYLKARIPKWGFRQSYIIATTSPAAKLEQSRIAVDTWLYGADVTRPKRSGGLTNAELDDSASSAFQPLAPAIQRSIKIRQAVTRLST